VKHQQRGDKTMPCAIVLGGPPCVAFVAPRKLPIDVDEIGVAGALVSSALHDAAQFFLKKKQWLSCRRAPGSNPLIHEIHR
jgi:hypothetical protein